MKEYIVYFEVYGKKMKTKVTSYSEEAAKEFIKNQIVFYDVKPSQKKTVDMPEEFRDIFGDMFR